MACARISILHGFSLGLTFADLDALKPPMISVSVAGNSTVLMPSTTRSATTHFPRFPDGAAFAAFGPDGRRRRD